VAVTKKESQVRKRKLGDQGQKSMRRERRKQSNWGRYICLLAGEKGEGGLVDLSEPSRIGLGGTARRGRRENANNRRRAGLCTVETMRGSRELLSSTL
jgi:hypothetical protein